MIYYLPLKEKLLPAEKQLSEDEAAQLDLLYELLDDARNELHERMVLYSSIYLTPTQQRRWFLYFKLGTIKLVAQEEGVSTAAISKSLLGTRDNERSKTRIRSPIDKLESIVHADVKIQFLLNKIKNLSVMINDITEE